MTSCPCQSGRDLDACCGAIIAGTPAPSPEALMRARYTAFLQGDMEFLEATLAPEKAAEFDRIEVDESAKDAKGLGFELRATAGEGDEGTVEYIARFRMRGQPYLHHEKASFRRDNGVWLYVAGDVNPKPPPRELGAKVGRNDPCPCGSGQKFKKCCGA